MARWQREIGDQFDVYGGGKGFWDGVTGKSGYPPWAPLAGVVFVIFAAGYFAWSALTTETTTVDLSDRGSEVTTQTDADLTPPPETSAPETVELDVLSGGRAQVAVAAHEAAVETARTQLGVGPAVEVDVLVEAVTGDSVTFQISAQDESVSVSAVRGHDGTWATS